MLRWLLSFWKIRLKLSSRRGQSKPVFLIASLTLAILFVMAYYLATTGWMDGIGNNFNEMVGQVSPNVGDSGS